MRKNKFQDGLLLYIADGISIPKLKKLSTAGTGANIGLGNHNATHKQHEEKKIAPKKEHIILRHHGITLAGSLCKEGYPGLQRGTI